MSVTTLESASPLGESKAAARKKRIRHLALMVFKMMTEKVRYIGGINREFDGIEDPGLIDAMRACSSYTEQIGCREYGDSYVVEMEGIDAHRYIIQFSLFGPEISIHASRVRITTLPLVEGEGQMDSTYSTLDLLQDHSRRLKPGNVSADRAFLVGMSMVIGLMDDQNEDDPNDDARLAPLLAMVMPTDDELRQIRTKLTPSSINYDEEGDQPY